MKSPAAFLLALAVSGSGCVIVSDGESDPPPGDNPPPSDDDPPPEESGEGQFDVVWDLLAAEDGATSINCPAAATTAEVVSTDIDTGERFVDCFDCSDFGGVTAPLALGDYDVHVNITDAGPSECGSGTATLLATSGIAETSLQTDGEIVELDFAFVGDGGQLRAGWILEDEIGELDCSEVEQDGVGILSTFVGPNTAFDDRFDCAGDGTCGDQCGTTAPLPVGDYEVVIDVLDSDGNSIAACGDSISTAILEDYEIVDLGNAVCQL